MIHESFVFSHWLEARN